MIEVQSRKGGHTVTS